MIDPSIRRRTMSYWESLKLGFLVVSTGDTAMVGFRISALISDFSNWTSSSFAISNEEFSPVPCRFMKRAEKSGSRCV